MTYIFVGGSQRSGTSIAQQMLCQLPAANPYLHEASFLRSLVQCYVDARTNYDRNEHCYFDSVQELRNFQSGVVHAFLEGLTQRLSKPLHLILKEPHLTILWPFLFELVPEAKFLLMVRDPRDVIASMITVGEKLKRLGQQYLFVDRDIPSLCAHFLSFYQPAFAVKSSEFRRQLGVVHYEELVTDPQQTLVDITKFTGVGFDQIDLDAPLRPGMVKTEEFKKSNFFSPWTTELSGLNPSKTRIGNHVNVLTPVETALVEYHCADFFEWFGYRRSAA
ncbi:sulfotransferase family protein [Fuerstiella marisgermanici]|uniref:Sulfotransferase domain protein n=1 Tax=Fuerstiella marisgermanici TaxID=1891926 RepID=A0A1P8WHY9_9PLAN|nr:sulfotransferase [Fuerstiella marisgermanici]APZ93679.1 Sulfotransferase domain protein [Fuerstiella marisgermanici]